VHLDGYANEF